MAFGDPILGEPELMVAEDALAFAGIAPPALRVYPIETHLAEKLHAYMMPRAFLDPVLTGSGGAVWDPTAWRWTVPASPPNPEQD